MIRPRQSLDLDEQVNVDPFSPDVVSYRGAIELIGNVCNFGDTCLGTNTDGIQFFAVYGVDSWVPVRNKAIEIIIGFMSTSEAMVDYMLFIFDEQCKNYGEVMGRVTHPAERLMEVTMEPVSVNLTGSSRSVHNLAALTIAKWFDIPLEGTLVPVGAEPVSFINHMLDLPFGTFELLKSSLESEKEQESWYSEYTAIPGELAVQLAPNYLEPEDEDRGKISELLINSDHLRDTVDRWLRDGKRGIRPVQLRGSLLPGTVAEIDNVNRTYLRTDGLILGGLMSLVVGLGANLFTSGRNAFLLGLAAYAVGWGAAYSGRTQ